MRMIRCVNFCIGFFVDLGGREVSSFALVLEVTVRYPGQINSDKFISGILHAIKLYENHLQLISQYLGNFLS